MSIFHLINDNARFFRSPTIEVSTVYIPSMIGEPAYFETCVFFDGGQSKVMERYSTWYKAVDGHADHCKVHGANRRTKSLIPLGWMAIL